MPYDSGSSSALGMKTGFPVLATWPTTPSSVLGFLNSKLSQ